jgi:hypothetical protein
MTAYIEPLMVEALISAPGCPETIVERALRQSMVDFYRESAAWRYTTEIGAVIRGRPDVELDLPADTFIHRVYWAKLDGKVLTAISPRNVQGGAGTPRGYAIDGLSKTLKLDPVPEDTYLRNGLQVNVALQPLPSLEELPDELFALHRDGILYGAIARLLAMANVSWGDLQSAQVYAAMAAGVKSSARREADSSQAPVARKVRYGGI